MDLKELRAKDGLTLKQLLAATREQLRDNRFRVSGGQLKDVRAVREQRREIARILTVMREKKEPV